MANDSTRLIDLTVSDLKRIIADEVARLTPEKAEDEYLYGVQAVADFLGVSRQTISYKISSGELDSCMASRKRSRRVIVNKTRLKKLMGM